jgi:hypothetical protein
VTLFSIEKAFLSHTLAEIIPGERPLGHRHLSLVSAQSPAGKVRDRMKCVTGSLSISVSIISIVLHGTWFGRRPFGCQKCSERDIFTASANNSSSKHSSHHRLIGRGVPGSSSFDIVQFLCDPLTEKTPGPQMTDPEI